MESLRRESRFGIEDKGYRWHESHYDEEHAEVPLGFGVLVEKALQRLRTGYMVVDVADELLGNPEWAPVRLIRKDSVSEAVALAFHELEHPNCTQLLLTGSARLEDPTQWEERMLGGRDWVNVSEVGDSRLEQEFREHAEKWTQETAHLSSGTQIVLHPSYQRIIGMGPAALPLIFRDLQEEKRDWFWALTAITGTDPVPPADAGDVPKMTAAWLRWGKLNSYV